MLRYMRGSAKVVLWFLFAAFVGGFLLYETSGLMSLGRVTPTTPIATVNGEDILYQTWVNAYNNQVQAASQQQSRALTLDEIERIKNESFDQLVADVLLNQELKRRRISVSDAEIQQAAQYMPPPQLMQSPELQTEGRFDRDKYLRLLSSPTARQSGLLLSLESYYRSEIPKQKLFEQVASDVFVTDTRLWGVWQDSHDTAQVSFVAFRPEMSRDSIAVSDDEMRTYFAKHRDRYQRPGRAAVSVITLPRPVTAADTAAARERVASLRGEIASGARSFEDAARAESSDSASGADGGNLGRGTRGRFVPEFEEAAWALRPGELSAPVLTPFGYHLIRVDERKGDTLAIRHILIRIQQSDSSAVAVDRRADSLIAAIGASAAGSERRRFDSAASRFGLTVRRGVVFEGEPLTLDGRYVPSVGTWAFSAKPGETSELFDGEDAYYVARLDSLTPGGEPDLERVRGEVRAAIEREKRVKALLPMAQRLAEAAAASSLEAAARAQGLTVMQSRPFTRVSFVEGIGQFNQAIGAAFTLPVGAVSAPVETPSGVYVIRVERRVPASRAAWEAQKDQQRQQLMQSLRQQRVQGFVENLRKAATIKDRRKEFELAATETDVL